MKLREDLCGRDARAPGWASSHDRVTPTGQKCRSILAPVVVEGGPSVLVTETKPVSLSDDPPGRAGAHYQRTLVAQSKKASFFKQVYRVVGAIPPGRVLTYGQIATLLGTPYQARQVGWAMHGCPLGLPWHRVVGAGGRLLTRSPSPPGGSLQQRQLLEQEGVLFTGERVDMSRHQFVPQKGFLKNTRSQAPPAFP